MITSRTAYFTALTGYLGLVTLLVAWHGWLQPPEHLPRSLVILFFAAPLLFPLRGLLNGRPYTFAWTSLLSLFYFTIGVVEAYANQDSRALATAEILFSLLLFVGAILYARLRAREERSARQTSE